MLKNKSESFILNKLPPHDQELERSIISRIVYKCPALNDYINKLEKDDFYDRTYQKIILILNKKLQQKEDPGTFDIPEEIRKKLISKDLIDMSFLTYEFENDFKRLKRLAGQRKLNILSQAIDEMIYKDSRSPDEIKTWISNALENIEISDTKPILIGDIDLDFGDQYIDKINPKNVLTGFKKLDNFLGGFRKGSYNLIAGDRSTGKSTFILNIINYICGELDKKVLLVSAEMGYFDVEGKLISINSEINSDKLMNPLIKLNDNEVKKINNARKQIYGYKLYLEGQKGLIDTTIIENTFKKVDGVDIIFVDYLGLLSPIIKGTGSYENTTNISKDLQRLSRKLEIPIVVICTLNRERRSREDKTPQLSDIRDSGNIEADIDLCLFLYRKALDDNKTISDDIDSDIDPIEKEMDLIIGKSRFGKDRKRFKYEFDLLSGKINEK
jgi:replicative DNA helicase